MREVLGDYELIQLIGKGGMAEVWRARGLRGPFAGRTVAVKRLLPEHAKSTWALEHFAGEADVCQRLRHPSIITVLETGVAGDTYYMVMEHVDGRDLSQLLAMCSKRRVKLPLDFACYVAFVVARALEHAHRVMRPGGGLLGLVHCDVSPSNIFISRRGEIRLGDFGIAQTVGGPAFEPGIIAGKVAYLAPEQITGEPLSPATDVFALGAILYEMLTGERAFTGASNHDVMEKIVDHRPPRPSRLRRDVGRQLDRVVGRALAVERGSSSTAARGRASSARYEHAGELAQELQAIFDPEVGNDAAVASVMLGLFDAGQRRRRSTNLGKKALKL